MTLVWIALFLGSAGLLTALAIWSRSRRHVPTPLLLDQPLKRLIAPEFAPPELAPLPRSVRAQASAPWPDSTTAQIAEPHSDPFSIPASLQAGAAAIDGAWPASELWSRWQALDDSFFRAVEHLSHQQIESVGDLFRVVSDREYAIGSDAFVRKLAGHVAEWDVFDHLHAATGLVPVVPEASNHPGFDMTVDDLPLNVKNWKDAAAAAKSHFAHHPDIAIVVPSDAARIPDDALHFDPSSGFDMHAVHGTDHVTIVDDALSHAEVLQRVEDGVSVLESPGGLDAHFPWVTLAVSSLREGQLVLRGDTEILRGLKNIAVDTAAVGGGALAGGKAGALMFGWLGPVGAAVGGVGGAIIGATLGRGAAAKVRHAPLLEARAAHHVAKTEFCRVAAEVTEHTGTAWKTLHTAAHRELSRHIAELESRLRARVRAAQQRSLAARKGPSAEGRRLLDHAEAHLAVLLQERRLAVGTSNPLLAVLRRPAAWGDYRLALRECADWERTAARLRANGTPIEATLAHVSRVPGVEAELGQPIGRLMRLRRSLYADVLDAARVATSDALKRRTEVVAELRAQWDELRSQANARLEPLVATLQSASERLASEMKKAGIPVGSKA